MKRIFQFLGTTIFLLFIASLLFFVWASSPTLDESEYEKLINKKGDRLVGEDSVYSIVTYNIGYLSGMTNNLPVAKPKELFTENLARVLKETQKVDPDIIAFQEIDFDAARSYHVNQQDEIATLGYNHIAKAINWDETYVPFPYWPPSMHFGKVVSGQSILSKYPIKNHERVVLERVEDNPFYRDALYLERLAQVVTIQLEGKEVVVINVHLEAFDKVTRKKQLDTVIEIFKKYAATNPTILLGDFNSDPTYKEPVIQKVFEMLDIGNAAFSPGDYELTFDTKQPFERLDYIFYTKNTIAYVKGRVLKDFGEASDHLPVEMSFTLK
ncbi:endonuclease/exonuclease/phosphatase family protein [Tenacibaculum maritimum]|uniref:endonuclease/exonuclease/phosphatase family protein n=1 Tax=Tenacibaculum maritimum TaxID=107401 RepID=UPI0012E45BD6|nr:endonuclease/exonuclease/phosphatase family protein [Tenacibaculum maritimum]CAA0247316.1 Endonuclease/exonuclease/phosphatase family protein [Tenacibaculum maritimum]